MRAFLFFSLLVLLFTSCFDMSMKVEVDKAGSVQYEGDFDLSSMMPLMMMAMEMAPDTAEAEDPFSDLLKSGEAIDSIMKFSDLEDGIDGNDPMVKKIDEQFKMRMQVNQAEEQFRLQFLAKFDDMKMQSDFEAG